MRTSSVKGVSRKVTTQVKGKGPSLSKSTKGLNAVEQDEEESEGRALNYLSTLSNEARAVLERLRPSGAVPTSSTDDIDMDSTPETGIPLVDADMNGIPEDDGDHVWQDMDGGDDFLLAQRDLLDNRWRGVRSYRDRRTWRARRRSLQSRWDSLIEPMTEAYLQWRDGVSSNTDTPRDVTYDFSIPCIDMQMGAQSVYIERQSDDASPVAAIVRTGYLPNTPDSPTLVVSFWTLELFRSLRLFKASLSIESFAKAVAYHYNVPYRRHYRNVLSDTIDVYLAIRRQIDKQVKQALGYDGADYRVQNSCPVCTYELEGEPPLAIQRMFVVDGNNSLKRQKTLGERTAADTRTFNDSDYFLSNTFVDQFANEVKSRRQPIAVSQDDDEDDVASENGVDMDPSSSGDPTDASSGDSTCTRNWKAAAADSKKKMWDIFDESGLFASCCNHGFIHWVCDMVRSGELAKYPIAIFAKGLRILGKKVKAGYDIGCSFEETIKNTSLAELFSEMEWSCCVNAMHGYTHEYACRLRNHPLVITGIGLEDLETLERFFSQSNALAAGTRFMSAYRRRVFIDLFLQQWDSDKYQNLANFLFNNYRQALTIITESELDVTAFLTEQHLTANDLETYLVKEKEYVSTLGKETDYDIYSVEYVSKLIEYGEVQKAHQASFMTFVSGIPADYASMSQQQQYAIGQSQTRHTETPRRALQDKMTRLELELATLEMKMGVSKRWTSFDAEYRKTSVYIQERRYRQELDKLHKLVFKRLLELDHLNLAATSYSVRSHMAKSLQARSKALRRALKTYNAAAQAMVPPRPKLDLSKVTHYSFLEEVHLLRDPLGEVQKQPWASPYVREIMRRYERMKRAREEIIRCNVGVRRLHTSILNERIHFRKVLTCLKDENSPILAATQEYIERRQSAHVILMSRIQDIYDLPGFTGSRQPGVRVGSTEPAPLDDEEDTASLSDEESSDSDDENELDVFRGLTDYVAALAQ